MHVYAVHAVCSCQNCLGCTKMFRLKYTLFLSMCTSIVVNFQIDLLIIPIHAIISHIVKSLLFFRPFSKYNDFESLEFLTMCQ